MHVRNNCFVILMSFLVNVHCYFCQSCLLNWMRLV